MRKCTVFNNITLSYELKTIKQILINTKLIGIKLLLTVILSTLTGKKTFNINKQSKSNNCLNMLNSLIHLF